MSRGAGSNRSKPSIRWDLAGLDRGDCGTKGLNPLNGGELSPFLPGARQTHVLNVKHQGRVEPAVKHEVTNEDGQGTRLKSSRVAKNKGRRQTRWMEMLDFQIIPPPYRCEMN